MLADVLQNVLVVTIVLAATGYLVVLGRRAWKGQGGCGSCQSDSGKRREESKQGQTLFMPSENLSDAAERFRKERSASDISQK